MRKDGWMRRLRGLALLALAGGVCHGAALAADTATCSATDAPTRGITDMAGRTVTLPAGVKRIATVGSVPVLNGYIIALGAGDRIVNGLPSRFTASGRWQLHDAIAPWLAERPVLQGQNSSEVNLEKLFELAPDAVLTMDLLRVRTLEAAAVPVVYLEWGNAADIRANMRLLGCILGKTERSEAYLRYLDEVSARVQGRLGGLAQAHRPKVLYFNPHSMSTPLQIANWWIHEAGGQSVTAGMGRGGNTQFSHEKLLAWNPDILITGSPEQVEAVYQDERFSRINAVRNRQVHAIPMGAHLWGQRTAEQPLTVVWAAKIFHPERFADIDMADEIRRFYRRFFDYEPSDGEIRAILGT